MVLFLTEYFRLNGLGHLRRCIAFSELFESKGIKKQILVNTDHEDADVFHTDIKQQNWLVHKQLETKYDAIIIDSYRAQAADYEHFKQYTNHLVAIDDDNRIEYPSGCIIYNGGLGGLIYQYDPNRFKKILAGPEYALLRKEFRENREEKKINQNLERILITMGGSDPLHLTSKLIQFYHAEFPSSQLDVIIGPGFTDFKEEEFIHVPTLKIYKNLDARSMCDLMIKVDLCITAGGQTIYELGKLGIPFIVIQTAENQLGNISGLVKSGVIESFINPSMGDFLKSLSQLNQKLADVAIRQNMSTKLKTIFQNKSLDIVGSILN
ncbi:glycosyl transferase [Leptospira bouyouniensis]|uniref:Glycosyl transferase n=1 Tax=Leptospira bouyouniensis TaxID=2484911 RepID=A0A7I0HMM5_9LEPT|nr:glycosyl transferase [Leptospira bouyouniensis]TGL02300.1 glycosyl transferase [Leptospira bouyouniensis]